MSINKPAPTWFLTITIITQGWEKGIQINHVIEHNSKHEGELTVYLNWIIFVCCTCISASL